MPTPTRLVRVTVGDVEIRPQQNTTVPTHRMDFKMEASQQELPASQRNSRPPPNEAMQVNSLPFAEPGPGPIGNQRAPAPTAETRGAPEQRAVIRALSHWAEPEAELLSAQQLKQALTWGGQQGPKGSALSKLQTAIGVPASGRYDASTAQAVAKAQRDHGLVIDGKGGLATRRALGLTKSGTSSPNSGGSHGLPAGQPAKDGVSVALYNQFVIKSDGSNSGDKEFERRATAYAQQYNAAGWHGGTLRWNVSTPFTSMATLTGVIQSIHSGLQHLVASEQGAPGNATGPVPANTDAATDGNAEAHSLPPSESAPSGQGLTAPKEPSPATPNPATQIKNLAIFTHGMEYGIAVDSQSHSYGAQKGLHKDYQRGSHEEQSNIHSFVQAASGALTPDVNVLLYACSTGRDVAHAKDGKPKGSKRDAETLLPAENEHLGQDSFASHLAQELNEQGHSQASVYGHTNAQHTTENPNARVFGYDAKEGGSQHLFELLYPPTFIQSELERLCADFAQRSTAEQKELHTKLRALMFSHYKSCIEGELALKNAGKKSRFGRDRYLGMEMFQDPAATAATLHEDFQQKWLPKHPLQTNAAHAPISGLKD